MINSMDILKTFGIAAKKVGKTAMEHPTETIAALDRVMKMGNKFNVLKKKKDNHSNENFNEMDNVNSMGDPCADESNIEIYEQELSRLQSEVDKLMQQFDSQQDKIDDLKSLLNEIDISIKEAMADRSNIKNKILKHEKLIYISMYFSVVAIIASIVSFLI